MKKSMRMRWISLLAAVSLAVAVPAPVAAAKTGTASSSSEAESDAKIVRGHPKAFTYRDFEWGASHKEIMQSKALDGLEDGIDYEYDETTKCLSLYNLSVAGKDALGLLYFNEKDQFFLGMYGLTETHSDSQSDYLDFRDIEKALIRKYGKPLLSHDEWVNDFYKGEEDRYGIAISLGQLKLSREWDAKDTSMIRISCYGDNSKVYTTIGYFAPNTISRDTGSEDEDDGL